MEIETQRLTNAQETTKPTAATRQRRSLRREV
jgi:hypothetical protein